MPSTPMIRVFGRDNGAGLSRDMALVSATLRAAGLSTEEVRAGHVKSMRWVRELMMGLRTLSGHRCDLQISLERVSHRMLPFARRNVLIPNPEWFSANWIAQLPRFDGVLCKTRNAVEIFRQLGCVAEYIGFTSEDRMDASVPRQRSFFHLAGRSSAKGTDVLLRTWRAHPEWPLLTVVQSVRKAQPRAAPNIRHMVGYLDSSELLQLQNSSTFHVCASEVEGFGHYLMEAMSVGAVVITTDGAPMNELITPERGILIAPVRQEAQQLGIRYLVDEAGVEQAVEKALAMDAVQIDAMSQAARAHFIHADSAFRLLLPQVVARLAGTGTGVVSEGLGP